MKTANKFFIVIEKIYRARTEDQVQADLPADRYYWAYGTIEAETVRKAQNQFKKLVLESGDNRKINFNANSPVCRFYTEEFATKEEAQAAIKSPYPHPFYAPLFSGQPV
tara:strand:- start:230 stop:556 length:327 start_codon:yes stop_codon:yes gene_type:complete